MMPARSVLGHEFCADVVAFGHEVRGRGRGDQFVAAMPLTACGHCRWCVSDEPAHCKRVGLFGLGGTPGAFAEYVRLSADQAALLAAGDINPGTFVTGAAGLDGVSDAFARLLSSTSERKILVTPNG